MSSDIFTLLIIGVVILLAGFLAVISLVNTLVWGSGFNDRLETFGSIPQDQQRRSSGRGRTRLLRTRYRLNSMLSALTSEELNVKLLSANWPITETEFILIRIGSTALGFLFGWLVFRSILPGLGFAFLAYVIPGIYLNWSISRRQTKFQSQLIDVLVLVKGAVQAGYSFLQAIDVVVDEVSSPASEEFRRVRREVGLGLPLNQALYNLTTRMESDDLSLVVTAVNINTRVGGNLSTMLEAVVATIRERVQLFNEIRALTSQQRFSGYLLSLLPIIVVAILFVISPDYIGRLFEPGAMLCIPIGALVLIILGNIVIRFMVKFDV
ncbi:MAG: type II secretion system F family protein [Anaerolineales bacterium]|nr:type II secretion system F family protein [Anaerolineales bacterium]